jgi:hypothetical protein
MFSFEVVTATQSPILNLLVTGGGVEGMDETEIEVLWEAVPPAPVQERE